MPCTGLDDDVYAARESGGRCRHENDDEYDESRTSHDDFLFRLRVLGVGANLLFIEFDELCRNREGRAD